MTQSRPFHVLLAMYLALWSPLWCCCSAKAAIAGVTERVTRADGEDHGNPITTSTPIKTPSSCCHPAPIDTRGDAPSVDEDCDGSPRKNHDQNHCDCDNHQASFVITSPVSLIMSWQPVPDAFQVPFTAGSLAVGVYTEGGHRHSRSDGRFTGDAARTLYAQHTLLLN